MKKSFVLVKINYTSPSKKKVMKLLLEQMSHENFGKVTIHSIKELK